MDVFSTRCCSSAYVSAPDVGGEYLVLFVEVDDLNQGQSVLDEDRL